MDLQSNLTKTCKDLMLEQPFYGLLLLHLNKEWNNTLVKTAGVGLDGINFKLYINSDFWLTLNDNQRKGLLQHELMHIAFFHLTDYEHLHDHTISNVAKDIEINQHIDPENLPPDGCTLEKFAEEFDLLPNEGTNAYYKKLMAKTKNQNKMQCMKIAIQNNENSILDENGDKINIPEHNWEGFDKKPEAERKLAIKQLERILEDVVEQIQKSCGNVPRNVLERIEQLKNIDPPKFNWKAYLRRYIGESTKNTIRKTKRKKSRRFELDFGNKIQSYSSILIGIDSSGSVSTKELEEFLNEIRHMYKSGHDFTIVFADTQMQEPFKYKPKTQIEVHGRGGTDFNPIVNYYWEYRKKYNTLIYLTDGECSSPDRKIKNMLWVLSTHCGMTNHLPGKTIKLN